MFASLVRYSVIALALTGCAKKEPEPAAKPDPAPAQAREGFKSGPIIDPVNFASGSVTISDAEGASIDRAVGILKDGDWTVMLVGLADATGDVEANKVLSQQRTDAVAAALRSRGISSDRIVVHAIGERLATGESVNERKVEFVFYTGATGMSDREIVLKSRVMEADFHAKP